MTRLDDNEVLYIRAMGKALRVVAIAHSDDEANAFMEKHMPRTGVVACFGKGERYRVYMADMNDMGVKIEERK